MVAEMNRIAEIVCTVGQIGAINADEDFYEAGVSSLSALQLLLELESACEVSIPDDQFIVARTPRALHNLIASLKQGQPL